MQSVIESRRFKFRYRYLVNSRDAGGAGGAEDAEDAEGVEVLLDRLKKDQLRDWLTFGEPLPLLLEESGVSISLFSSFGLALDLSGF